MEIIDFIRNDPETRDLFLVMRGNSSYSGIPLPTDLEEFNTFLKVFEENPILHNYIKFINKGTHYHGHYAYMCDGILKDEYYDYFANAKSSTLDYIKRHYIYKLINIKTFETLKRIVEIRPEFLGEPGSEESSAIIGRSLDDGSFSSKVEVLNYLKERGYIIIDPKHISGRRSYNSRTIASPYEYYGFAEEAKKKAVKNVIVYVLNIRKLKELWDEGFDKDMRFSTRSLYMTPARYKKMLPNGNQLSHTCATIDLVDYTLFNYKTNRIKFITEVLHFLKEIGIDHENSDLTKSLLDICLARSKKMTSKHQALIEAVNSFSSIVDSDEDSSSFSS